MLKEVFYFLKGYVIIKIEGKFPERFLNVAGRKGILFWDVKSKPGGFQFKIMAKEFPQVDAIAENCGCKARVLGKIGLPFTAKRHRKRKALLWGLGGFAVTVFLLVSVLWNISVTGNEKISEQEILNLLSESGIRRGVWVYGIDKTQACNEIAAKNADIAWIGIEIKGSCAFVEIVEKVPKPYIEDKSIPCNIVSTKSGVVEKMQVRSGEAVVQVGDAVFEGQLLVSGIADSTAVGIRYLHSDGDLWVRVWHEKEINAPLYQIKRIPTGNTKTKYTLHLFGMKVPLYFPGGEAFSEQDVQTSWWGLLEKNVYSEVQLKKEAVSESNALSAAEEQLKKEMEQLGEVLNITKTYEKQKDALKIYFTAEVLEQTGEKREIERDTNGENLGD